MVASVNMSTNMESPSHHITVVDVYDLASIIGKDFEHIIDKFGVESVAKLMPKVISALELLEAFASRNESENEEVASLKTTVLRLESEKVEKKEGRLKFETVLFQEMEQMEENYRNEIRQLWDMVRKLQEENKRLSANLEQKLDSPTQQALKEEELAVMLTLQDNVDKQRDVLKAVSKECDEKSIEVENLQRHVEKLQRTNKELTRKNKVVQSQGRALVEEKADMISVIQDRDQFIAQLQIQLGETEKARKDLEETKIEPRDVDCEHVPRFTLAELREVLQEKNMLKAKVMELEEELNQLRPAPAPSPNPSEKFEDEDGFVVYGPINREPEEKLFPWKYERRDSGVRNFLLNMFRRQRALRDHKSVTDGRFEYLAPAAHSSFASSSKTFLHPDLGLVHDRVAEIICQPSSTRLLETNEGIYLQDTELDSFNFLADQSKRRQQNFRSNFSDEANDKNLTFNPVFSSIDTNKNHFSIASNHSNVIGSRAVDVANVDSPLDDCDVDRSIEFSLCDETSLDSKRKSVSAFSKFFS